MEPAVLEQLDVSGILRRPVYDLPGVAAGQIVDVLADETGETRAAVSCGGFIRLSQRRVAVTWQAPRGWTPNGRVTAVQSADEIGTAAECQPSALVTMMAPL